MIDNDKWQALLARARAMPVDTTAACENTIMAFANEAETLIGGEPIDVREKYGQELLAVIAAVYGFHTVKPSALTDDPQWAEALKGAASVTFDNFHATFDAAAKRLSPLYDKGIDTMALLLEFCDAMPEPFRTHTLAMVPNLVKTMTELRTKMRRMTPREVIEFTAGMRAKMTPVEQERLDRGVVETLTEIRESRQQRRARERKGRS